MTYKGLPEKQHLKSYLVTNVHHTFKFTETELTPIMGLGAEYPNLVFFVSIQFRPVELGEPQVFYFDIYDKKARVHGAAKFTFHYDANTAEDAIRIHDLKHIHKYLTHAPTDVVTVLQKAEELCFPTNPNNLMSKRHGNIYLGIRYVLKYFRVKEV